MCKNGFWFRSVWFQKNNTTFIQTNLTDSLYSCTTEKYKTN